MRARRTDATRRDATIRRGFGCRWSALVTGERNGETTPGARRGGGGRRRKERRDKRELIRKGTRKLRVSSCVGVTRRCLRERARTQGRRRQKEEERGGCASGRDDRERAVPLRDAAASKSEMTAV